jgi:AcrR family transcriptional regulator
MILARACELVVAHGLQEFSMRHLGKALGVSAPALYRHFRNREELLVAVTSEAATTFSQYMFRSLEGATPRERLRQAGVHYMNFALDHPRYYEVIHQSRALMGITNPPAHMVAAMCATGQFLVDRVRECMDAGLLRKGDPDERALTIWAHSHGVVSLYLRGFIPLSRPDFERWFQRSFALILAGIGEPGIDWREGIAEPPPLNWPVGGLSAARAGLSGVATDLNSTDPNVIHK